MKKFDRIRQHQILGSVSVIVLLVAETVPAFVHGGYFWTVAWDIVELLSAGSFCLALGWLQGWSAHAFQVIHQEMERQEQLLAQRLAAKERELEEKERELDLDG